MPRLVAVSRMLRVALGRRGSAFVWTAPLLVLTLVAACSSAADGPSAKPIDSHWSITTPTSTPTATAVADDPVALAAPTNLSIPSLGIDTGVEEYTDAQVADTGGWVDPVHRDIAAWWSGGGSPGNPADNTVYIYGHVAAQPAVFNGLADAEIGQEVVLTTQNGTLTYQVSEVLPPVLKGELPDVPEVAAASPGRLILIGCHREPEQGTTPTTRNTVVIAEQVTSVARTTDPAAGR